MSTYTGKYSGSGTNPVPAKGSFNQDDAQDTGKQKHPKQPDYAGGMAGGKPVDPDLKWSGGNSGAR